MLGHSRIAAIALFSFSNAIHVPEKTSRRFKILEMKDLKKVERGIDIRQGLEWSGWRESNPRGQFGRLELYH